MSREQIVDYQNCDAKEQSVGFCNSSLVGNLGITTNSKNEIKSIVGETKMSNVNQQNRKVVNIQLLDNDKGLDVGHALVCSWGNLVVQSSNEATIRGLLLDGLVKDAIDNHNELRMEMVNRDILLRTGLSVNLLPVKLEDLTWVVNGVSLV
jgi:hypothetical protein